MIRCGGRFCHRPLLRLVAGDRHGHGDGGADDGGRGNDRQARDPVRYRDAETSTDAPESWQDTTDTNVAGNSERNTGNLTLTLGSNLMVQFGVAYSSSSGTSVGDVAVSVGVRRT